MTGALAKPPRAVADPAGGREYDLSLYDIAYLRGGTRELLKLRLLELVHAGYLVVQERHKGRQIERRLVATPVNRDRLLAMDKYLIKEFTEPRTAPEVHNLDFPLDLAALCGRSRRTLVDQKLLVGWVDPDNTFPKFMLLVLVIPVILIVAELVRSLAPESRSGIMIAAVAGIGFYFLGAILLSYNRTPSGDRYLRDMENSISAAHGGLIRMGVDIDEKQFRAVAVHGFSALATSEFDALALMFGNANPRPHYGTRHAGRDYQASGCGGCGCG